LTVTPSRTASGASGFSNDAIDRAIEAQLDLFDLQIESLRDARSASNGRDSLAFNQSLQNLQASLQNLGSLVTMQEGGNANLTGSAATDARSSQPSRLRDQAGATGLAPSGSGLGVQGATDARSASSTNLRGQEGRGAVGVAGSARQTEMTAGRRDSSNLRRSGTLSGRSQPANLPSFDERRLVETDLEQSLTLMEDQLDELSRATGRFTTAERILFRQRIDDLEARLRNVNMRLNSLQGRTGRAWLEARAELDALMAELAMEFQETGSLFGGDLR
jgi:hypothetical protein